MKKYTQTLSLLALIPMFLLLACGGGKETNGKSKYPVIKGFRLGMTEKDISKAMDANNIPLPLIIRVKHGTLDILKKNGHMNRLENYFYVFFADDEVLRLANKQFGGEIGEFNDHTTYKSKGLKLSLDKFYDYDYKKLEEQWAKNHGVDSYGIGNISFSIIPKSHFYSIVRKSLFNSLSTYGRFYPRFDNKNRLTEIHFDVENLWKLREKRVTCAIFAEKFAESYGISAFKTKFIEGGQISRFKYFHQNTEIGLEISITANGSDPETSNVLSVTMKKLATGDDIDF